MGPLLIAAVAAKAASSLFGGIASKAAAKGEAANYRLQAQAKEREAKFIDLETAQRKAAGLIKLGAELGQISAVMAARNVSSDSPSTGALMDAFQRESLLSINADELAGLIRRRSTMDEARGLYGQAKVSNLSGNMSLLRGVADAGFTIASAFKPTPKPKGT